MIFSVDKDMDYLQVEVPSLKQLHLEYSDDMEDHKGLFADYLIQANNFIIKHKNFDVQIDISFIGIELIGSNWRLNSKTQFNLPIETVYPRNTKDIASLKQRVWASGIKDLDLNASSASFLQNTEVISFIKMHNSTVSTMEIESFSTDYMLVLDGFFSLRILVIRDCIFKKFPSLSESLKELIISYVNDLTMSDMDHGITLPTQLRSLYWYGNISCFTLPKIPNIDKLLDLKNVGISLRPFEFTDKCDDDAFNNTDSIARDFLRISNTCTIDQLQQFVSQLPSDLEILKIGIGGYIRNNLDDYSACCPDKLSFDHFANLGFLQLSCLNNKYLFNVSAFPSVEHLKFTSAPVLNGCFS
ncbi:unnamed protein product [Ambrosiozyma monospora]|uniref:Unnamed protein product n=1 Tax=Ambrosiozyma monospora TaxID=43982 RepID=A0ACB5STZ3_AMBMO|nr:unnamed protein product [Ambrosiozyma monospora]